MPPFLLLTVDDGPTPRTPALVDELSARRVPAVFFWLGENLERHPGVVDDAIRRGVLLGNHSYSHPDFARISFEEGCSEVRRTEALLDDAYRRNGVPRPARLFRFPYLSVGGPNAAAFQHFLQNEGFVPLEDSFVTRAGYREAQGDRLDVSASWAILDWELWGPNPFGRDELLHHLRQPARDTGAGLTSGSGELLVIHDADWAFPDGTPHWSLVLDELDGRVSYVTPYPLG